MKPASIFNSVAALVCVAALAACSGHGAGGPLPSAPQMTTPTSVSPATIAVAPMATTQIQPASAMQSVKPDLVLQGLGYSQIPGTATQVAASPDGTIWILSNGPAGPDKYIWHYTTAGVWVNIGGLASQIAVAPDASLYAINSGGGTYRYKNNAWSGIGGGAVGITVASNGAVLVLSNDGHADHAIWQYLNSAWTQKAGAGTQLAASWDWGSYTVPGGTIAPGGFYIINSTGAIYYENTAGTFATLPGAAASIAPTTAGGVFVLGYPANAGGTGVFYNDLATGAWSSQAGSGVSLSANTQALYIIGGAGGIYKAPVTPVAQGSPNGTLPNVDFISNSAGNPHYWGASAPANAFGFPVQSGYSGDGRTIAIVIDAVPVMADMTQYLSLFKVARTGQISVRPVDGGGAADSLQGGEATLDAETTAGTAPGANIIIYDIPDLSDAHIDDAYNAILSDGRAQIVNLSFGGCEYTGAKTIEDPIFAQMNAAGIAVSAASGDTGNACYFNSTTYPWGPSSPASDPYVIGVGGTNTDSVNANILTSAIWNDCGTGSFGDNCISGGGLSTLFPTPSYQTGLAGAAQTARNVPHIALPGNNAIIRLAAGYYLIGGTSWSAPLNAGMLAGIYQYCNTLSIPNAVKMYYNTFASSGYASFSDVTAGNDQYFTTSGTSYTAATGFDNVGGIGQPNGMAIAAHICPGHVLTPLGGDVRAAATVAALPAEARKYDNLRDLRNLPGLTDLGERSPEATTRVGILLRATSTLHTDEAALVAKLQAAGFTITQRFPNALLVDAEAPASTVARYFATGFRDYAQAGHGTRFTNTTALTIPASIAPYVQGIVSDSLVTKSYGPLHLRPVSL